MRKILLFITMFLTLVTTAFAQNDYYIKKAQSYQREAEYFHKKAESYRREAEYYLKKANGYQLEAAYYTKKGIRTAHVVILAMPRVLWMTTRPSFGIPSRRMRKQPCTCGWLQKH